MKQELLHLEYPRLQIAYGAFHLEYGLLKLKYGLFQVEFGLLPLIQGLSRLEYLRLQFACGAFQLELINQKVLDILIVECPCFTGNKKSNHNHSRGSDAHVAINDQRLKSRRGRRSYKTRRIN